METTKLSSKGQVIIPKPFRNAHQWEAGQELIVIDTGDGILLKPKTAFPETSIENVTSFLQYSGKAKSIEEMESAIQQGAKERFSDSD